MCNCNKNVSNSVVIPETKPNISSPNCLTTLDNLNTFKENLNLFIITTPLINSDFILLNNIRGKILSAINIVNYCYVNFEEITTQLNEIKSKYN